MKRFRRFQWLVVLPVLLGGLELASAQTPLPMPRVVAKPADTRQVRITFRVLEGAVDGSLKKGTQRIVAAPEIIVKDGREGFVLVGKELAARDDDGKPMLDGIRATATPTIQPDGQIQVAMRVENSKPQTTADGKLLDSGSRSVVMTAMMLKPGETVVVGELRTSHNGKPAQIEQIDVRCEILESQTAKTR